jgi:hypothetical protein
MQIKAIAIGLAAAALATGTGTAAAGGDPPNFDFNGYAQIPAAVNGPLVVRAVLTNNGAVPTPIPLDFANNQYTLVIFGALASDNGTTQQYALTGLDIFEDPIASGTAADYAAPGTFTDGVHVLGGVMPDGLVRLQFTPSLGNFLASVDFVSGTRQGDLSGPTDWPLGGGWSRTVGGIPPGYHENWDGKIDLTPVGVDSRTWQDIKKLYH